MSLNHAPHTAAGAMTAPDRRQRWRSRVPALGVVAVCGPPLVLAALLEADPAGLGTHRQLGLPPCGFHHTMGIPCVTCGYTTAFAHAADGRLLTAARVQPGGALFALAASAGLVLGVYGLLTAAPLAPLGRWLWRPATLWISGAVVLCAWVYKIIITWA